MHGIFAAVPYCIDLIGGPYLETDEAVCKAFRPKSAAARASRADDAPAPRRAAAVALACLAACATAAAAQEPMRRVPRQPNATR